MNFDLEYKLQQFREIEIENFDTNGKSYTGSIVSKRTAEMMLQLINELESELGEAEISNNTITVSNHTTLEDVEIIYRTFKCNRCYATYELIAGVLPKICTDPVEHRISSVCGGELIEVIPSDDD